MSIFIYMSIIIYQVGMAVLVKKCQVGMAEWQVGMAVFVGREGSVWLFLSVGRPWFLCCSPGDFELWSC